jgi:hypothetical protein
MLFGIENTITFRLTIRIDCTEVPVLLCTIAHLPGILNVSLRLAAKRRKLSGEIGTPAAFYRSSRLRKRSQG